MQLLQSVLSLSFALHIGLVSSQDASNCNANNCLRQVRASAFPTRSTRQDCSAFQTRAAGAAASIPAYASSCGDAAEYSSACSCIGITGKTTTSASVSTSSTAGAAVPNPTNFGILIAYKQSADTNVFLGGYMPPASSQGLPAVYLVAQSTPVNAIRLKIVDGTALFIASPASYASQFPSVRYQTQPDASILFGLPESNTITAQFECSIAPVTSELTCQYRSAATTALFAVCTYPQSPQMHYLIAAANQAAISQAAAAPATCLGARLIATI